MATRNPHTLHDCAATNCNEISKHMPVSRWKALKSLGLAVLISTIAIVAIVFDGQVTPVAITAIIGILVAAGVDINEVEIAKVVSVTFRENDREE